MFICLEEKNLKAIFNFCFIKFEKKRNNTLAYCHVYDLKRLGASACVLQLSAT